MTHGITDRRKARRHNEEKAHGIVSARVRPGHDAKVIDVSASGALIETHHRLLPGTVVDLKVERDCGCTAVRARVLRCAVFRVRPSYVCYRGAIGFERHLPWLVAGSASGLRAARRAVPERAPDTHEVI